MHTPPLIGRARRHRDSVAIRAGATAYTYDELLNRSAAIAVNLLEGAEDLREARVAFLVPAGFDYVATQWGIWRTGGVAVPLSLSATEPELEYTLTDSQPVRVVTTRTLAARVISVCDSLGLPWVFVEDIADASPGRLPDVDIQRRAMILYTSGTTSRPKGVVTTHANIQAQMESLVEAWRWRQTDRIPLFLPLHHVHGIVNVLCCALWSGASVEAFAAFETNVILDRVAAKAWSVFMAVPTIYVMLIQALETMSEADRSRVVPGFAAMRLMVSGSAALPASVHRKWTDVTGQMLLERYGMTEIGMALSNPYDGERRPGTVGQPLPGVQVRLKSDEGTIIETDGEPGEIQVHGPSVFSEYRNRPDVTSESFEEGWFRTGDMAVIEDGYFRIMGRQSVDIIKSGGYKLSALEIEAVLLEHPAIRECAVVGVADETWGEAVAAAVVLYDGTPLAHDELRAWCGERVSHYKIPKQLLPVESLPRNAMGKVTKPDVAKLFGR